MLWRHHLTHFVRILAALCGQHGVRPEHWSDSERTGLRYGELERLAVLFADFTGKWCRHHASVYSRINEQGILSDFLLLVERRLASSKGDPSKPCGV